MSYNKETRMYEGYIYKITNNINGKIYIGQTIYTVEKRWSDHKSASKKNSANIILYKAIKKYGENNFKINAIEKIETKTQEELFEKLNNREIYYIKEYNSLKPSGYNMTAGGNNNSPDCKRRVIQYDFDGNKIGEYESLTEAVEKVVGKGRPSNIGYCCMGITNTAFGYVWRYEGDSFELYDYTNKNSRQVVQYTKDGEKIKEYDTMSSAARELGYFDKNGNILISGIANCCSGIIPTIHGFVWRYKGDDFYKYSVNRPHVSRPINIYNGDGIFIEMINSVRNTAKKYLLNETTVVRRCSNINHKLKGKNIQLYYSDDPNQPDKSKIITTEEFRKQQLQAEQQTA